MAEARVPARSIEDKVLLIRGQKVLLDDDLAQRSEERRVGKECRL